MLLVCTRCDAEVAEKVMRRARAAELRVTPVNCLGVCDDGPACCVTMQADAANEAATNQLAEPTWIGRLHKKKYRRALYDWMGSGGDLDASTFVQIEPSRKAQKRLRVLQSGRR